MTLKSVWRLWRWRATRSVRAWVRRVVPRSVRESGDEWLELATQTHGVVIRSRVNLTLRARVLAVQTPMLGYVSHARYPLVRRAR